MVRGQRERRCHSSSGSLLVGTTAGAMFPRSTQFIISQDGCIDFNVASEMHIEIGGLKFEVDAMQIDTSACNSLFVPYVCTFLLPQPSLYASGI